MNIESQDNIDFGALQKTSVGVAVQAELNTAISTPTADSLNERIESIDDKLPAGNISDLTEAQSNTQADLALTDAGVTTARMAKLDNSPEGVAKNTALNNFMFLMRDSTTDAPKTGLTVTPTRSLDGAAFTGTANAVTEVSDGYYKIDLAAADLNGDIVALKFTSAGANDTGFTIKTNPT